MQIRKVDNSEKSNEKEEIKQTLGKITTAIRQLNSSK